MSIETIVLINGLHRSVVPYLNYSTLSEPCDEHIDPHDHHDPHESHSTAGHTNANVSLPPSLDPFDEEDWDFSMTSSLPTEFDLRPDLTPTGEECQTLSFETPEVRSSPSHLASNGTDSDETCEQISDIVDQNSSPQSKAPTVVSPTLPNKPLTKLYAIVRTSILSSLLVIFIFSCLLVLIIESDSDLFSHLRKLPELVVLRRDYYEPLKDTVLHSIGR